MAGEEIVFTAGRLYRVDRQGSVRWSLFSEGSLRCIQNGDWVSSQLLEDCFQNDLGEHVILPGQILYDVKVIHTTQLLERGLPSHAEKCLSLRSNWESTCAPTGPAHLGRITRERRPHDAEPGVIAGC